MKSKRNSNITFKGLNQNGLIIGRKNTDDEVVYSFTTGEEIDLDHINQDLEISGFTNKIKNKNDACHIYTDEVFSSVYALTLKYNMSSIVCTEKCFNYYYNIRYGWKVKRAYCYIDIADIEIMKENYTKYDVHIISKDMSIGSIMNIMDENINENNDIYVYNNASILDAMIIKYHMLKSIDNIMIERLNDYYVIYTKK